MVMEKTVVRRPTEGDAYWFLGGLYEVKIPADETNDALTVMQFTMPEGYGPPPHTHEGSELIYVIDGRIRCHIGGEISEAGAGSFVYIPKDTLEWFEPIGTARVLVAYTPGGLDRFFAAAGERAKSREIPPPPESPPDLERLVALGAEYGLHIEPPPQ